jgi:hypothetical protein
MEKKNPNPQNISMWSRRRKKLISENNLLKEENRQLKVQTILSEGDFINLFGIKTEVYFEIDHFTHDEDSISLSVSNYDFNFGKKVFISFDDIIERLPVSGFTKSDIIKCIGELIQKSLLEKFN